MRNAREIRGKCWNWDCFVGAQTKYLYPNYGKPLPFGDLQEFKGIPLTKVQFPATLNSTARE